MKFSKCSTYVIGEPDGRLPQVLAKILGDYRARHGTGPTAIIVNRTLLVRTLEALEELGESVPVDVSGGCLTWEVWLAVADGARRVEMAPASATTSTASLLARVQASQREMTPARARQLALGLEE